MEGSSLRIRFVLFDWRGKDGNSRLRIRFVFFNTKARKSIVHFYGYCDQNQAYAQIHLILFIEGAHEAPDEASTVAVPTQHLLPPSATKGSKPMR